MDSEGEKITWISESTKFVDSGIVVHAESQGGMIVKTVNVRRFLADTLTMIILSSVTGMIVEVGFAGYSFRQSAMIRLAAVVPNLLTARLNGAFTDIVRNRVFHVTRAGWTRRAFTDITAFALFQIPLYVLIQVISTYPNVEPHKILVACGTLLPFAPFLGIAYGMLLNLMRKVLRVSEGFGLR